MSLPSWERGLKLRWCTDCSPARRVAPLVGAWIEIMLVISVDAGDLVAPLVGAWIEIRSKGTGTTLVVPSLPSWERGLKLYTA